MIYNHISELIGNTPLLKIGKKVHGLKHINVYAKLEYYNPFGSVKDRVAWGMIKDDIKSIQAKKQTIVESSSGNTAKALQGLASTFGIPFKTITNRIKVGEVKGILQLMGAEIEQLPGYSECPDPDDPNDPLAYIEKQLAVNRAHYFYTSQYTNQKNIQAHYEGTGTEIINDLPNVDYFFATVGTSGSSQGVAKKLKEHNRNLKAIGIVGESGDYIPGIRTIGELREVELYDRNNYTDIVTVKSKQGLEGMLVLLRKSGVLAGPTSGTCYSGMMNYLQEEDKKSATPRNAVFIVCDRIEWYGSYIKERRPDLFGLEADLHDTCEVSQEEVDTVPVVDFEQAMQWIQKEEAVVVDVRGNQSFNAVHIPGSLNIPDNYLEQLLLKASPFNRQKKVIFVCPLGKRSKVYTAIAKQMGYEAYNLESGLVGWKEAGMPVRDNIKIND